MRLEALAAAAPAGDAAEEDALAAAGAYAMATPDGGLDAAPCIRALLADQRRGLSAERLARRFHLALAGAAVAAACVAGAATDVVVLSGGVFANQVLTAACVRRLRARGKRPLVHRRVPAGDGGLSLGQLAIVAARDARAARARDGAS
jgi:hydrogenase maturation protein HypF